ncbi:MAG: hypothetical protein GY810_32805 [Aureispira sp.]|nr:hypothetical protein [Aureispira sp.]
MKEDINPDNLDDIKVELTTNLKVYAEQHNFNGLGGKPSEASGDLLKAGGMILLLVAEVLINGLVGLVYLLVLLFSGSLFSLATLATIVWAFMAGPYVHFIVGSRYGLKKLAWEFYSKALRPVVQETINVLITKWLDKIGMKEASTEGEKTDLLSKIKDYIDDVLSFIPPQFQSYFSINKLSKDVVGAVYNLASQDAVSDEMIQEEGTRIFESFDRQIQKTLEPSLVWIYLVMALNVLVWGFIWFGL